MLSPFPLTSRQWCSSLRALRSDLRYPPELAGRAPGVEASLFFMRCEWSCESVSLRSTRRRCHGEGTSNSARASIFRYGPVGQSTINGLQDVPKPIIQPL